MLFLTRNGLEQPLAWRRPSAGIRGCQVDFAGRLGRALAVVVNAPQQIVHAPEQYVIRIFDQAEPGIPLPMATVWLIMHIVMTARSRHLLRFLRRWIATSDTSADWLPRSAYSNRRFLAVAHGRTAHAR